MANDEHNFGRLNAQDKTLTVFGFAFLGNGPRHNFVVPFFRARLPQLKNEKIVYNSRNYLKLILKELAWLHAKRHLTKNADGGGSAGFKAQVFANGKKQKNGNNLKQSEIKDLK